MNRLHKLITAAVLSLVLGAMLPLVSLAQPMVVDFDIKPQSCPNPLNTNSKGTLPVAILGTDVFDVNDVDPATLLLEGVAPLRWYLRDVSTPMYAGAEVCECNEDSADGYMDLTVKFDRQAIVAALGTVSDGDEIVLTLTGMTVGGVEIMGQDCVAIIHKERD